MKAKRMSPSAINALKESLCCIYWYKSELKSYLMHCLDEPVLVNRLNWDNNKRQIASDLVDMLCQDQDRYLSLLTKLCYQTISINNFTHLELLDEGRQKVEKAKKAVTQLKEMVEPHQDIKNEQEQFEKRKTQHAEKLKTNQAMRDKLIELKGEFLQLVMSDDPQGRGYILEKLMYDIFVLFDLDPKAAFKVVGEQIDGAFHLEGTEYLFEAKWQKKLVAASDLDSFSAKVSRKLDNTLGVFLAMEGFSQDGISAHSRGHLNIILMDGADIMAVLEERIDLSTLLLRKKRHAAQTGEIFLQAFKLGL